MSRLVDENLALRAELAAIEAKVDEADAMIARLRLYDAELRSLTEAKGAHGGPLPRDELSNAGLPLDALDGDDTDMPTIPALDPALSDQPAAAWAASVSSRLGEFVDVFRLSEPGLNAMMADLEGLNAIKNALPNRWPVDGVLSSGFGWRRDPIRRTMRFHAGLDIANARGTAVVAAAPGIVVKSTYGGGYGNYVEIDHGFGIATRYGHLARRSVSVGEFVTTGDYIGAMGSTGRSTGPHLHFEVLIDGNAHDPLTYLPR